MKEMEEERKILENKPAVLYGQINQLIQIDEFKSYINETNSLTNY